jgi:hypothetical protein
VNSEQDLRAFCALLIADRADADDERALAADPAFTAEVEARLAACGLRIVRDLERPLAVIPDGGEGLSELSQKLLARCALALAETQPGRRARISVRDLWQEFGRPGGYSEAFLRRSGLGPLETRSLVKVIKPGQRAADAYVVAGPALKAIDVGELRARLDMIRSRVA